MRGMEKMFNYLEWLQAMKEETHIYFLLLITIMVAVSVVDLVFGYVFAHLNRNFSSRKARIGLTVKLGIIIIMVLLIPITVILPDFVTIPALSIFYSLMIIAELKSVLSHLGLVKDDKETGKQYVQSLFEKLLGGKKQ